MPRLFKSALLALPFVALILLARGISAVQDANPPVLIKLWSAGNDTATSGVGLAVDSSNNIYVTGDTYTPRVTLTHLFLIKYDSAGNLTWQRVWGGNGEDYAKGVATDEKGNVYVAGFTNGFSAQTRAVILLKFAPSGNMLWQRLWDAPYDDAAYSLSIDSSGNIFLTGVTGSNSGLIQKYDPAGNLLWEAAWRNDDTCCNEGWSIATFSNSFAVVTGFVSDGYGTDIAILKFDSSGNLNWAKVWGNSTSSNFGYGVATDPLGNIYVTGNGLSVQGGGILMKLDSSGRLLWEDGWNGLGTDIAVNSSDIFVTCGNCSSNNTRASLLDFDTNGNLVRQWFFSGVSAGLPVSSVGDLYLSGNTVSPPPYTLEPGNLTISHPTEDVRTASLQFVHPSVSPKSVSGQLSTPPGNQSYSSNGNALMLRLGPQPAMRVSITPLISLASIVTMAALVHNRVRRVSSLKTQAISTKGHHQQPICST